MKLLPKLLLIIILTFLLPSNSFSRSISLIRDSQTEDFLKKITYPLLQAANLNPKEVKIYIVNDSNVNAFVMSGRNIFIHSGLITKYEDPNVLIGVIAHEIGHIAASHLARSQEAMNEVGKVAILSYLAGIAAAVMADGDAGYAIISGSNHVAQRLALRHTRSQEEAADKLALEYLKKSNESPLGLMKLLKYFHQNEAQYRNLIDEYALTHPISKKRINYIESNLDKFSKPKNNKKLQDELKYVIAKLEGFLRDSNKILMYRYKNNSFDRYARSIAYFKKGELQNSLNELNILIKNQPKNGYFYELKAQILFENGKIKEAIKFYHKAMEILPNNALARISISQAILSLNTKDKELINFAINNLNEAKIEEKSNLQIFRQLAKAYEKINAQGKSYLALAELNLLKEDYKKTKKYANLAIDNLEKNDTTNILKAQDILEIIKDELKKEEVEESEKRKR